MVWGIGIWCGVSAYGVGIGILCGYERMVWGISIWGGVSAYVMGYQHMVWRISILCGYQHMVWRIGIWCGVSAYVLGYRHMVWGIGVWCGVSAPHYVIFLFVIFYAGFIVTNLKSDLIVLKPIKYPFTVGKCYRQDAKSGMFGTLFVRLESVQ